MKKTITVVRKGNISVSIYSRVQVKADREYLSHSVADYSSGKRRMWTYSDPAKAKEKADAIADALIAGELTGLDWKPRDKRDIQAAMDLTATMGMDILPAVTLLLDAVKVLEGRHGELLAACHAWQRTRPDKLFVGKLASEVAQEFLSRQGCLSARRQHTLKSFLNIFCGKFGGVMLHQVEAVALRDFVDGKGWAPRSQNEFVGALRNFYADAALRNLVPEGCDPFKALRRRRVPRSDIHVFEPREARQILDRLDEDLIPFVSIWLFAGIRKDEINRMSWEQVNHGLATGAFRLEGKQTKTGSPRTVAIEENLRAWLLKHRQETGPILPLRYELDHVSRKIAKQGGVVWKSNGPRHSYASYKFKVCKDAGIVVDCMGTSLAMFERHYRRRGDITEADALEYFNIMPPGHEAVIQLPVAGQAA